MTPTNPGQIVADAWESAIKTMADPFSTKWLLDALSKPRRKHRAPSKTTLAKWRRERRAYQQKDRRIRSKFKGRIVRVEGDQWGPIFVYADGRKLTVREWEWETDGDH